MLPADTWEPGIPTRVPMELEVVQRAHLEGGHRTAAQKDDWTTVRKAKG